MKFKYLGTAAAEAIPAVFCNCERCKKSRNLGGKNIRTRSQALINDDLLIDMPCDTYSHFIHNNIDWNKIENCIITHSHEDHLYEYELRYLTNGFSKPESDYKLQIFGNSEIYEKLKKVVDFTNKHIGYTVVEPFIPFKSGKYTITALKAYHSTEHPYFYIISDREKNVLYAHDTDIFPDKTWEYLKNCGLHFDLVSLDCTNAAIKSVPWKGHMTITQNAECKDRLLKMNLIDDKTRVIANHFSHNSDNVVYDDFVEIAAKYGIEVSFDGMEIIL